MLWNTTIVNSQSFFFVFFFNITYSIYNIPTLGHTKWQHRSSANQGQRDDHLPSPHVFCEMLHWNPQHRWPLTAGMHVQYKHESRLMINVSRAVAFILRLENLEDAVLQKKPVSQNVLLNYIVYQKSPYIFFAKCLTEKFWKFLTWFILFQPWQISEWSCELI